MNDLTDDYEEQDDRKIGKRMKQDEFRKELVYSMLSAKKKSRMDLPNGIVAGINEADERSILIPHSFYSFA